MYGKINVNLKGTKTELKAQGFLAKIFGKKIEVEKEVVTQAQYLEGIYNVFKELGFENVLYLDVNGDRVYEDEEHNENDFQTAIKAALEKESEEVYHIEIALDTTNDEETNIEINMYSKHSVGEFPIVIDLNLEGKKKDELSALIDQIKSKIEANFEVENFEVELDEEDEDSDESKEDSEEEKEKENIAA